MNFRMKSAALSAIAAAVLATSALADGMPKRGMKAPSPAPEQRACSFSANAALATQYVFRGFSQTAEEPAIQGGFDATCGMFYAGVWASNLDWGAGLGGNDVANIEMDWYAGFKPKTGHITWDIGLIYYSYPGSQDLIVGRNNDYLELKVGASGEIWKDGTLGVTVFYSPDYQYETGQTWTVETGFSQGLPKVGMFTPTFSALLGWQTNEGTALYMANFGNTDDTYLYWNAGITLGFMDKWSLDLRYWDTNLSDNGPAAFCNGIIFQCDERFVATLKFAY
jgi:uncharacterized protein (TIGR02001 family)